MRFLQSRYGLVQALAATVVLLAAIFSRGFGSFWQQFVHGLAQTMTPKVALASMAIMSAFFAAICLALFASTCLSTLVFGRTPPEAPAVKPDRFKAVRLALLAAVPVSLVAIGLNVLGAHAIEWCTGVRPADQDLVKCFVDPHGSVAFRALLVFAVLFQAPLLEEPLFRGIIFRGFARSLPLAAALALSGFIFALVHVNAASFLALWYLGVAFAWIYARTGTILAPMTMHFVFNGVNLVLLFLFPGLAT